MMNAYPGDWSDIERRAANYRNRLQADLKAAIARRPPSLRLPRKGFRFRALRDVRLEAAAFLRHPIDPVVLLPMEIKPVVVAKEEILRLEDEPDPAESTHCLLIPERYEELQTSFVAERLREDEAYAGYALSASYVQLDADFEWLTNGEEEPWRKR